MTVFIDLELRLARADVRRNTGKAGEVAARLAIGLLLLLLALLLLAGSAVAALARVLPLWLAALMAWCSSPRPGNGS